MRRIFTSCVLALAAAAIAGAQDTAGKAASQLKADDSKTVTITGCLNGGPMTFVLTNAAAAIPSDRKQAPAGTPAIADAYLLVPRDGVALAPHVGRRVELVGMVVADAPKPDPGAPDSKEPARTRAARGPNAQFAVTSVKMISPVCIE